MNGPKVISSAYDFIRRAIPHIAKFPRNQRYTLGERVENKLFCLLELITDAQYSRDKANLLKKANLKIEQMRYLMRLCYDLGPINLKTYELSSRYLMDIGAQIGGWIKQQAGR